MGACFSFSRSTAVAAKVNNNNSSSSSAKVVTMNSGDLREYPVPVMVSHVLEAESACASSWFVCNSDNLYYDQMVPALDLDDQLQANQIYFVLPSSKRERPLSASDMAALAVKASVALQTSKPNAHTRCNHRNRSSRISPLSLINNINYKLNDDLPPPDYDYDMTVGLNGYGSAANKNNKPAASRNLGISRSGSVRKLQRFTSRRAKMAVRSFRLRLTTIYEGTIL